MFKSFLFLLLLFPMSRFCSAQTPPRYSLKGTIMDSASGTPLANAGVDLYAVNQSTAARHSISNQRGIFSFNNLPAGDYRLDIAYVGYRKTTTAIQLTNNLSDSFRLTAVTTVLQNLVIQSVKPLVENQADKIVFNADRDVSSQGGVATDLLRKIPQVTVDASGNVEILGNPSIQYLINGQPSALFSVNAAEALQSIPVSQIQRIEVISTPGAKYASAGTGGMINIILKKSKAEGFSLLLNTSAGTRLENGSLNFSYKKNNQTLNIYASGNAQLKAHALTTLSRQSADSAQTNFYTLLQDGFADTKRQGGRAGLSWQWDYSKKAGVTIEAEHHVFGNSNAGQISQEDRVLHPAGVLVNAMQSLRISSGKLDASGDDITAGWHHDLKKDKSEISVHYFLSTNRNTVQYDQQQQYIRSDSIFTGSSSRNPGTDMLQSVAADLSIPLNPKFVLETGLKSEWEVFHSNAGVYSFSPASYQFLYDPKQSYNAKFRRQVYSVYVSATAQLSSSVKMIAGARMEQTENQIAYSTKPGLTIPSYFNLGPSFIIAKTLNAKENIKLSYAYRLERPSYSDMNPFYNLNDPHNISAGNPLLKTEIGNNVQLAWNRQLKGSNSIVLTGVLQYNSPDIKGYTRFYPVFKIGDSLYSNVNFTTRDNIASETRYGLNISGNLLLFNKLTIRPNIQLYERQTTNKLVSPSVVKGFEYRGNINLNLPLKNGWIAEAFGNYNAGLKWQGRRASFSSYTFSCRKQFSKGRTSLGFTAVNALGKYLYQKTIQEGSGFNAVIIQHIPYRSFGISFQLKLGKMKITPAKEEENLLNKPPAE